MPFEPLKTDEPLTSTKKKDFEGQLMAGCSVILVSSVAILLFTILPWAIFPIYTAQGLISAVAAGAGIAWLGGIVLCRKFAVAGAAGFLGGVMASGIFMYLRMEQIRFMQFDPSRPEVELPSSWTYGVPLGWLALAIATVIAFLPKEKAEKDS